MSDITLEQFEAEATAFLDSNASLKAEEKKFVWGEGSDKVTLFDEKARTKSSRSSRRHRPGARRSSTPGSAGSPARRPTAAASCPSPTTERGPRLEDKYAVPNQGFVRHRARHGRAHDPRPRDRHREGQVPAAALAWRHRRLPAVQRAGAGSDLAGAADPAPTRDGDEWIINGQKVWTSGAQYSDIGEIITRSDPDMPKHKGLTGFIVDMHAPGVEVRPLRQMTGGASFNEVFFTDVRVRDDHRLGDVNEGLDGRAHHAHERACRRSVRAARAAAAWRRPPGSSRWCATTASTKTRSHARALADLIIRTKVASYTNQRAMDKIKMGQLPGPEMSIAKLALTQNMTKTAEFVANVLGPRMVADSGEWGTYAWGQFVMGIPGMRIAGGSDEVMRNIVGERVLGLPKDAGIDSTTPFRDLKVGTQTKS